ncbi:hypothetical protein TRAPUB_5316 [Trametes pubescens]|uniref:Uncharacterized protein n=1 Tax=Trametes pubescens TaxID=154538 RepID=A0A1M2V8V9_TRAPU|nr:hypothetical protein TRAPUB_5316 [Trametes pubescens]
MYHCLAHINRPLTAEVEIYVQADDEYQYDADNAFPEHFRDYLLLDAHVPQYERFLQDACALLQDALIRRVRVSRVDASLEAWREFFATFPGIEGLTIVRCDSKVREQCAPALGIFKELHVLKVEKMEWAS